MATIFTSFENPRGCGYRKKGGIYLVSGKFIKGCDLLPIPLTYCKCCGAGIKPARGWTWIDLSLFEDLTCPKCTSDTMCLPFYWKKGAVGLLWVGGVYYDNPSKFINEAVNMVISRRISAVPRGFEIGKTWVLLAHRKAIPAEDPNEDPSPGVISAFLPEHIDYIVKGDETEEELDALEKLGFRLVSVVPVVDQKEITYN